MGVENLLDADKIFKKMDKRYKLYKNKLITIMSLLFFDKNELKLYKILLKKKLKIKELSKRIKLSERTVRRYVKTMLNKGFIKRRVVEGKRLAYEYYALSPQEAWNILRKKVETNMKLIEKKLISKHLK